MIPSPLRNLAKCEFKCSHCVYGWSQILYEKWTVGLLLHESLASRIKSLYKALWRIRLHFMYCAFDFAVMTEVFSNCIKVKGTVTNCHWEWISTMEILSWFKCIVICSFLINIIISEHNDISNIISTMSFGSILKISLRKMNHSWL